MTKSTKRNMTIEEEAIRNTYDSMLKSRPENKKMLDIILKMRLSQIGIKPE